jgi:hypothetical protein
VLAVILFGTNVSIARPFPADDTHLDGNWKLVVLQFGEDEFAIVKLVDKDGAPAASVTDAQQMLGRSTVKTVERKDGVLTISLDSAGMRTVFKGRLATEGASAGKILGTVNFRGTTYPARLEPTKDSKVAAFTQSPLIAKYQQARQERDPKSKIKKLEEAILGNHGNPNSSLLYGELLSSAESAGLDAKKIADAVKRWIDDAKPYGDEWANEVRLKAVKAVASNKSVAKMTVELAEQAERVLPEQDTETKATLVGILARAARTAGMTELASTSESRQAKLEKQLDDEYHHKVPPFKPTSYTGRTKKDADRVVLMELFTGAQCPPCVAADVGFDALLKTYRPADFIGLQYHLHIPGPDPLTNNDSLARQRYYGNDVRGTPSTFFNGHSQAGGGGPMANSEQKYAEFRQIIDQALESSKGAKIDLSVTPAGDQIKIVARAESTKNGADSKDEARPAKSNGQGGTKTSADKDLPKRFLRLALTEESVRYVGGNRLRFHHHVVRSFPGGAEGTALKDGSGKIDVTVSLADLKRDLEKYLNDFTKSGSFPNPLPEIKLEKLAVVAFVQDDGDKSILDAVSVPVETGRP